MSSRVFRNVFWAIVILGLLFPSAGLAATVPQYVWIPFNESIKLEANIYRPAGAGPHPLAIINHGRAGASNRSRENPGQFEAQAQWFVKRGFAVVVPVRRGYGKSGGGDVEHNSPYEPYRFGMAGAASIKAVADYMTKQADIDAKKILLVGFSAGGLTSIAAASQPFEGLVGVVNFAGGTRTSLSNIDDEKLLYPAFTKFGKTVTVPTLWIFAYNDSYFPLNFREGMYKAFTAAGGKATMVKLESDASHLIFPRSATIPLWEPAVSEFLESIQKPAQ